MTTIRPCGFSILFGVVLSVACATGGAASAGADDGPTELPPRLGERGAAGAEAPTLAPAPPAKGTSAIVGATLMLGTGARIADGTIVMTDGKVSAVGPSASVKVPKGATIIDGKGKFVTPGLIDTHSHMGVYAAPHVDPTADGNEMTDPTTPYVFSEHAFWPQDPAIEHAVAGGITTIQVLPGSGNVIGGRAVTLKLRPRLEARAMRFPGAPFGLKMACGENPKRVYGKQKKTQPMSRMGNIRKLREAYVAAKAYAFDRKAYQQERVKWDKAYAEAKDDEDKRKKLKPEPKAPNRDLGKETLAAVMAGKIKVHIHCYRADEMLLMISLSKELGYQISSFHHAVEAYKIADVLAKEGVAASMWADWWGFKLEAYDGAEENAAIVAKMGGLAIIHSDSNIGIQRLNQEAAKALHSGNRQGLGLTEDDALKWVTLHPAKALGVDDKTGTLEVGKMADVVLWDKSPFSIYARAERVFVDGSLVFDKNGPAKSWSDFEVGTESERVKP